MPFLDQITQFINGELKAGSLKNKKLQPAKFFGIASIVHRSVNGTKDPNKIEAIPGIISAAGSITPLTPDDKTAIQVYHKLISNVYSLEKKGFGDRHDLKSVSELAMLVFTNSKLTGKVKESLEPLFVFGMPQKLSTALLADLKINNCLITILSSNMDQLQVFRQEFPQSAYFLNDQMGMFLIRYKIEMTFNQVCVDQCLCE